MLKEVVGCDILVILSICPRKENAQDKQFQISRLWKYKKQKYTAKI